MSHKRAKENRKAMNEFTKKTGPLPGVLAKNLPQNPSNAAAYEIKVLFSNTGMVVGVVGPTNMALPVLIDHLATGIKAVSFQMIQNEQQDQKLIEIPKVIMPRDLRADG